MITCRQLAELLLDVASGEVMPEHRDHVEQHLRCCPSCVAYVETYKLTIRMARQLPRPPLPPHLEQKLLALLKEEGGGRGLRL